MSAHITNFQAPKDYDDLLVCWDHNQETYLDSLLVNTVEGKVYWTVDIKAQVGDIVFFMCAKTSIDHMSHTVVEAKEYGDAVLIDFALEKQKLYKKYAGCICAVGKVLDEPSLDGYSSVTASALVSCKLLDFPIHLDFFREFITVSKTGSITRLDKMQTDRLFALIAANNEDMKGV